MTLLRGDGGRKRPPNPNPSTQPRAKHPKCEISTRASRQWAKQEAQKGPEDLFSLSRSPCGPSSGRHHLPLIHGTLDALSYDSENKCLLASEKRG